MTWDFERESQPGYEAEQAQKREQNYEQALLGFKEFFADRFPEEATIIEGKQIVAQTETLHVSLARPMDFESHDPLKNSVFLSFDRGDRTLFGELLAELKSKGIEVTTVNSSPDERTHEQRREDYKADFEAKIKEDEQYEKTIRENYKSTMVTMRNLFTDAKIQENNSHLFINTETCSLVLIPPAINRPPILQFWEGTQNDLDKINSVLQKTPFAFNLRIQNKGR